MEEKFLKLIQLADELNEKQNRVYAEIHYTADNNKKLEIAIRSKKDFSYIEKCEVQLNAFSMIKWDNVITLFETFVGGAINE